MSNSEQNRAEQPTSYKLTKARQKGSVARGTDLGFFIGLVSFAGYMIVRGPSLTRLVAETARKALVASTNIVDGPEAILAVTGAVIGSMLRPIGFMAATIFLTVLVFEFAQTGAVFSTEPLRLDFGRLNPANGLKRLFSARMLVETLKNVLKLAVYGGLASLVIWQSRRESVTPDATSLLRALSHFGARLIALFVAAALLFAAIDQLIARRDYLKKMRMSRREIRREARDREGEPRLKQRRKQLHREFTKASQSLRGIRGADVLITNPTHIAVALRYSASTMRAPRIVSQSAGHLAQRIKNLAFTYSVTIIQEPALARALFYGGRLNEEIPDAVYARVADIYNNLSAGKGKASQVQGEPHV